MGFLFTFWLCGVVLSAVTLYFFEIRTAKFVSTRELISMLIMVLLPLVNVAVPSTLIVVMILGCVGKYIKDKYGSLVWRDGKFKIEKE